MPGLSFELTNPRLWLEAKKDSETWTLGFDAIIKRPEGFRERFKIFCCGEEYDGYSTNGVAIIEQRISRNELQEPLLTEPNNREGAEEVLEETPCYIRVGYLPPEWQGSEKLPPRFEIHISLSTDTFLRVLQAKPETRLIHLWISTEINVQKGDDGFSYGNDPDGKELEWRVEKKNHAHMDFLRLTIKPRPLTHLG
ncbi:MAG TPA: hypothetical protein VHE58_11270 [Burkholderiales bacterium]|nr:hypothetical protein [Burkholderiales bacterium]